MSDTFPRAAVPETDIWRCAAQWLAEQTAVALATVVDTWGSSPVPLGGQMVIAAQDKFQGSVSGGCVEAEVITAGLETMENASSQLLAFGVSNETAWQVGLPCGGRIEVYVECLSGPEDLKFAETMATAETERSSLLVVRDLQNGDRRVYSPDEVPLGNLTELFKLGRSKRIKSDEEDLFVLAVKPPPRIAIIGATHIAQALVSITNVIKAEPIVIDPREAFASKARFGETQVVNEWPSEALETLGADRFTAVVALSHVAHIDDDALTWALRSDVGYIGALGSRRNHAKRCERLQAAGFSEDTLARINCPIGLDIGAVTPEEIALSTAAEVVLAFRQPKRKAET